jgi:enamidase
MTIARFLIMLAFLVAIAGYMNSLRAQTSRPLALVGATVIDGTGAAALSDAVIIIESGRIRRVGPRSQVPIPDGAERKDLTGLTVLPGLIDSHVHINFALPRGPKDPEADATINKVFQEFLRHGVTSIRDLGAGYPWIIGLAHSVDDGQRESPRIFAAGPMLTAPGGHPAGTLLRGNDAAIAFGTRQITSPEEGRSVVRDLAGGGVDVIKAVLDSGGRPNRPQRIPTINAEVLGAIIAEAQKAGVPVTVHWGNVDELPTVIAARPTQIEHAGYTPIPAPVIAQIARAGITVDPTLAIFSATISSADEFANGPLENVRRLHAAGVAITAGTDAPLGNLPFGESLHRELELLVKAGLSPMEAIQAATSRPAHLLKRGDEIGTIQAGKRADLVAVAGDPLRSISDIRKIRLVLREGRVVEERHE